MRLWIGILITTCGKAPSHLYLPFKDHLFTHGYRSNGVAGNLPSDARATFNIHFCLFQHFYYFFFPFVSLFCLLFKSNEGFFPGLQGPVFLQFFSPYTKYIFLHFINKYLSFLFSHNHIDYFRTHSGPKGVLIFTNDLWTLSKFMKW